MQVFLQIAIATSDAAVFCRNSTLLIIEEISVCPTMLIVEIFFQDTQKSNIMLSLFVSSWRETESFLSVSSRTRGNIKKLEDNLELFFNTQLVFSVISVLAGDSACKKTNVISVFRRGFILSNISTCADWRIESRKYMCIIWSRSGKRNTSYKDEFQNFQFQIELFFSNGGLSCSCVLGPFQLPTFLSCAELNVNCQVNFR